MRRVSVAELLLVLIVEFCVSNCVCAQGIVDCVYPGRVSVSRVQGQVFDPFGTVVPGVLITLVDEHNVTQQAISDAEGRFHLEASPRK